MDAAGTGQKLAQQSDRDPGFDLPSSQSWIDFVAIYAQLLFVEAWPYLPYWNVH